MGTEQRFYYIELAYSTSLGDTIVFYTNVYRAEWKWPRNWHKWIFAMRFFFVMLSFASFSCIFRIYRLFPISYRLICFVNVCGCSYLCNGCFWINGSRFFWVFWLLQAVLEMLLSKYSGHSICCWFKWHWQAGNCERWISCYPGGNVYLFPCYFSFTNFSPIRKSLKNCGYCCFHGSFLTLFFSDSH